MHTDMEFYLELNECSGEPLIKKLQLHNRADRLEGAVLQIRSTSKALIPLEIPLPVLESGTVTELPQAGQLQYDLAYLDSLFHPLTTEMVLTVSCHGIPVYSWARQFSLGKLQKAWDAVPAGNTEA